MTSQFRIENLTMLLIGRHFYEINFDSISTIWRRVLAMFSMEKIKDRSTNQWRWLNHWLLFKSKPILDLALMTSQFRMKNLMMLLIGPHFYGDEYGEGRMGAAGKGIGSRGARDVERAGVATPPSSAFPSTPCSLSLSLSTCGVLGRRRDASPGTSRRRHSTSDVRRRRLRPSFERVALDLRRSPSHRICRRYRVSLGFFLFFLFVCLFFFCNEPRSNSTRSLWSFVPGSRVVFARFIDIL